MGLPGKFSLLRPQRYASSLQKNVVPNAPFSVTNRHAACGYQKVS